MARNVSTASILNQPAQSQKGQGKKAKGSPKLKRAGRANTKARYARQEDRTAYNKLRRTIRSNGEEAATALAGIGNPILARVKREYAEERRRRGLAA